MITVKGTVHPEIKNVFFFSFSPAVLFTCVDQRCDVRTFIYSF